MSKVNITLSGYGSDNNGEDLLITVKNGAKTVVENFKDLPFSIISFTIDDIIYLTLPNLDTWEKWVASSYNDNGYKVIVDDYGTKYVYTSDEKRVVVNDTDDWMAADWSITEGYAYKTIPLEPDIPEEPEEPDQPVTPIISFTIDGTDYKAIKGMTWSEWCDDQTYNTHRYWYDVEVYDESGNPIKYSDGSSVYDGHVIEANGKYYVDKQISFTIDGTAYTAEAGMIWLEWCAERSDFTFSKTRVLTAGGLYYVTNDGIAVAPTDPIYKNVEYGFNFTTISFTIDDKLYSAIKGMTWAQWCEGRSDFKVNEKEGRVLKSDDTAYVTDGGMEVAPSYTIDEGIAYGLDPIIITFTIDGTDYKAIKGMTWLEWCYDQTYNTIDLDVDILIYSPNSREYWITDVKGKNVFDIDRIIPKAEYYLTECPFTIDNEKYTAIKGMNWAMWCDDASYNTNEYWYNTEVYDENGNPIKYSDGSNVYESHEIEANGIYLVDKLIRFTIDGTYYGVIEGTTWEDWVKDTNYNTRGYKLDEIAKELYIYISKDLLAYYIANENDESVIESIGNHVISSGVYKHLACAEAKFTIGDNEYKVLKGGMPWQDWFVKYHEYGFKKDDTGIISPDNYYVVDTNQNLIDSDSLINQDSNFDFAFILEFFIDGKRINKLLGLNEILYWYDAALWLGYECSDADSVSLVYGYSHAFGKYGNIVLMIDSDEGNWIDVYGGDNIMANGNYTFNVSDCLNFSVLDEYGSTEHRYSKTKSITWETWCNENNEGYLDYIVDSSSNLVFKHVDWVYLTYENGAPVLGSNYIQNDMLYIAKSAVNIDNKLITFKINNTTYIAEANMNLYQWSNSEYDFDDGYMCESAIDGYVYSKQKDGYAIAQRDSMGYIDIMDGAHTIYQDNLYTLEEVT